jgi:hypothetical protein
MVHVHLLSVIVHHNDKVVRISLSAQNVLKCIINVLSDMRSAF